MNKIQQKVVLQINIESNQYCCVYVVGVLVCVCLLYRIQF